MSKKNVPAAAESDPQLQAAEVPGLGLGALSRSGVARPGWCLLIPGDCLKRGSLLWSEAQRESGVWVKGIYLSASEEEESYNEAARLGVMTQTGLGLVLIKRSLHAIASTVAVDEKGRPSPGQWSPIPPLERLAYWEELGPIGRSQYTQSYHQAHAASKESALLAQESFRQIG